MTHGLGPGKPGPRAAKPITPQYVEHNYRIEVKITFMLIAYLVLLCEFYVSFYPFLVILFKIFFKVFLLSSNFGLHALGKRPKNLLLPLNSPQKRPEFLQTRFYTVFNCTKKKFSCLIRTHFLRLLR